jgi:hypothetical protein
MQLNLALIAGEINGKGLFKLTESLTPTCLEVRAAIAYASIDNMILLNACKAAGKTLTFYGRYDQSVPVHPDIIKWFLEEANPNFVCRVVPDRLHAKVIWWMGEGVYIGSANMTQRAWFNNIEAGTFLSEKQLEEANLHGELERFFAATYEHSQPITNEFFLHLCRLAQSRKPIDKEEAEHRKRIPPFFGKSGALVPGTSSLAHSQEFLNFQREWNESLQFLRDIGEKLDRNVNRPRWVPEDTPMGAHVDQFIHAYYYKSVQGGRGESFVRSANQSNRLNRSAALDDAIIWWRASSFDFQEEKIYLEEWATLIRETFERDKILNLSEPEFAAAMSHIHALREVARYRKNSELQLPEVQQDMDVKVAAHLRELWRARNRKGQGILELLNDVIWSNSGKVEWRIWSAACAPNSKISHVGLSTLGELVGWVRPYNYPPRNNRTLKGLFSLGYPVRPYDKDE